MLSIHKDKRVPDHLEYQEYYDRSIKRCLWWKFVRLPPGNEWPSGSWVVAGENYFLLTLFQTLNKTGWVVYAQGRDDCTCEREFATLVEAEEQFDKIVDGMNEQSLTNLFQFERF